MMQIMREKTQGIIAGAIAVLIALTFALWGIQNYLHGGSSETQVVATVNGKEITRAQENIAYEHLKRSEMLRLGQDFFLDQNVQLQLKKNVRQQLIKKEVVAQAMAKMGFNIGKEQLWAIVIGLPIFQINGHFSAEYFKQITERFFYSQQTFLDGLKYSFLQAQLEEGIVESAFDLPNEVQLAKKLFKQRRDFGYFFVTPERFAKTVEVSASDIQKYYEQHQSDFTVPEKISIQYIELFSNALRNKIKTSEEQLKQYYQSHISSFSTPKKWQVMRVLLPLSSTADAKVSDDAQKKLLQIKVNDDLTKNAEVQTTKIWLTRNEIGLAFPVSPDKLNVGQISKPLRTKDGYVLEKILAVQPETVMPYKAVAAKVKQAYEHQQLAQFFSEANDKLVDLTYTNSDSLEPAAKELGLKIQKTDLVTKTGIKKGILANNKIANIAFSETVLKQGYNSNPIELEPGRLVVLRIKDHIPEVLQPLDEVRANIIKKLKIEAMQKKAYDFSQELVTEMHKGKAIAELARQFNLTWQVVTDVGYEQKGNDAQLIEAVFNLAHPSANEISAAAVDLHGEYAVVQLLKVYESKSHSETSKEIDFLKSLAEQFGRFDYQLLIDNLMSKAKIKIKENVESK